MTTALTIAELNIFSMALYKIINALHCSFLLLYAGTCNNKGVEGVATFSQLKKRSKMLMIYS
jgi:hypothetical protein